LIHRDVQVLRTAKTFNINAAQVTTSKEVASTGLSERTFYKGLVLVHRKPKQLEEPEYLTRNACRYYKVIPVNAKVAK
jgi:hypothetical protein